MKESIYRRMVKDTGLLNIKRKKKSLLSEKLMKDLDNEFGANEVKSLGEFLKRNKV
jgi:hypothetical protein